jgi:Domain of unknown function (DUF2017)
MGDDGARNIVKTSKGPLVRTKHGTYKLALPKDHCEVLTHLITELRDSLLTTTDDASLRRLFPTAYHNDAKKDAEYQRLMREELLASRLSSIETALKVISSSNELSESEVDAFARSINSLRLVIGTSLDIAESDFSDSSQSDSEIPDSNPDELAEQKLVQRELYDFLGWLLEWTVSAQSEGL